MIADFVTPNYPIKLGISTCLMGENVRFDGGHKRHSYVMDTLSHLFQFEPHCPEMAIGLGVPRPSIQLVNVDGEIRVRGSKNPEQDFTAPMQSYADKVVEEKSDDFSGYILKSKSPSCGMARIKINGANGGMPLHDSGIYAKQIMQRLPDLPFEEEGRLNDPILRENFITRVYAYAEWEQLRKNHLSKASVIEFHTRYKLLLLAHNQAAYRRLGKLVAQMPKHLSDEWCLQYRAEFMSALSRKASRKSHINVLQHILGYFKSQLALEQKHELLETFDRYSAGNIPLVVPITLLKTILRQFPSDYLPSQRYFSPYPDSLGLRNHL